MKRTTERMSLGEALKVLERAGFAQTRKTYLRHGASEPLFGVSFATLKGLVKRIGVDHELAGALWASGNFDARNLAVKIADPARMMSADLDRWVRESRSGLLLPYVAMLAAEGPWGSAKADAWLASKDPAARRTAWALVGQLVSRGEPGPDAWFGELLIRIERELPRAPSAEREAMNAALIAVGGRSPALRKAATAVARRLGKVEIDHGDTACRTPDAAAQLEKTWAHATSKGFASPAAQERERESPRRRC